MENKKEMTAPIVSAATDTEQPFQKCSNYSITKKTVKFNIFREKGGGCNG